MTFLNRFHKEATERKKRKIAASGLVFRTHMILKAQSGRVFL